MTRITRIKSRSPESFPASSSASRTLKHRRNRKTPKKITYFDDYSEPSQSQPQDDDDQEVDVKSNLYIESDSISNESNNHFSLPSQKGKNTLNQIVSLNSGFKSQNESPPITQNASYMNIVPFPIFNGTIDECPIAHISRFNKVCRANNVFSNVDMMMKIFAVTLENEAALWYDLNIEPYPSLTWEEIKSTFVEAYSRNDYSDQFKSELVMLNQNREEPVRSYFLRLQWVLKKWPEYEISDGLIKGIFIDGLREEFQDWVIPQKPETLDDALRLAFTWEQVRIIRKKDVKCGFCGGAHEESDCEIRERMRELWVNNTTVMSENGEAVAEEEEEVGRAVSGEASSVVGRHEVEILSEKKKSQCQCGKHKCWKKKIERNNSVVSRDSNYAS